MKDSVAELKVQLRDYIDTVRAMLVAARGLDCSDAQLEMEMRLVSQKPSEFVTYHRDLLLGDIRVLKYIMNLLKVCGNCRYRRRFLCRLTCFRSVLSRLNKFTPLRDSWKPAVVELESLLNSVRGGSYGDLS